jgi:protein-histidine pros-kinase
LERDGHTVTLAANGREAVEAVRGGEFDLVLMDVQMPEMDGLDATREIRRVEAQRGRAAIPIIALTAHALATDRDRCLEAGMNDYVSKPLQRSDLVAAMRRVLRPPTVIIAG